ncbi:RNA polymerase sigma factor, partial [Patulibacter sp. S7RM1-6]
MPEPRPLEPPVTRLPPPLPGVGRGPGAALDPGLVLAEHAPMMLRVARRVSLCEDDAHDAVQAAAERFLTHRDTVEAETVAGWLATVARNEALRVRERRVRTDDIEDDDRRLVHPGDGPDDRVSREEDLALAREALAALKPQERLALWMQAEGHSYDEIAARLDWTRTKVNRSITEGRASLRAGVRGIAAGESCAAAGPRIERLAAGTASA